MTGDLNKELLVCYSNIDVINRPIACFLDNGIELWTITGHLDSRRSKICYADDSVIQMSIFKIPTVLTVNFKLCYFPEFGRHIKYKFWLPWKPRFRGDNIRREMICKLSYRET